MSQVNANDTYNEHQYLQLEQSSEYKHELEAGHLIAMTGASKNHNLIAGNLFVQFRLQCKGGPCDVYQSDMKLKTPTGNFRYPDCMIVCEDNTDSDYIIQSPSIIVEVLSRSTRKTDNTTKYLEYINIESLQHYLVIEQDFVQVTLFSRQNQWQPRHFYLGDSFSLSPNQNSTDNQQNITLSVEQIYENVNNDDMNKWLND